MRSKILYALCIAVLFAVFATAEPNLRYANGAVEAGDPQYYAVPNRAPPAHGHQGPLVAKRQNFIKDIGRKVKNTVRSVGNHIRRGVQKAGQVARQAGQYVRRAGDVVQRAGGIVQQASQYAQRAGRFVQNAHQHINRGVQKAQKWVGHAKNVANTVQGFLGRRLRLERHGDEQ
ncbi:hypothetical protein H310_02459 [Aphanomyces invadans]|uniref:Uncharacterized protein n=1 Tax=Aphanomyces invadans TaxID=157072 RepID=A0A024UR50_9STRA|nr:hypothetical protein H310_02459 [Aphanomyces invadans]ETW08098.1 hypothetical protein H310_02459 [Aphanomyces invadans]|eukprot:XP_008864191.1 hypothetical protein H310_02459 [Aphanomyces invadans]